MFTHGYVSINHPLVNFGIISRKPAKKLVVFVHGWRGSADSTWGEFIKPPTSEWWKETDLIFIKYDSVNQQVAAAADRLRAQINDFYPQPFEDMLLFNEKPVREKISNKYEELFLVGHSMGGLVLRRAAVDALDEWKHIGYLSSKKPAILDGKLRLFSPASAGFDPSGFLGLVQALPLWFYVELFVKQGASYQDLKKDSSVIKETRRRTEKYRKHNQYKHLIAANILWANPENVVKVERYDTDASSRTVNSATHREVCKPKNNYISPFGFVENGEIS